MVERTAFVKTGWSEEYSDGPVVERHAHILKFEEAHQRFNLLKALNERFQACLPPIGRNSRSLKWTSIHVGYGDVIIRDLTPAFRSSVSLMRSRPNKRWSAPTAN